MGEDVRVLIRVPAADAEGVLPLLQARSDDGSYEIVRMSEWRSVDIPWSEILVSLSSVGSVTAVASVIRAWLASNRAKVEVVVEATGKRLTYEGPAARVPTEELERLLSSPDTNDDQEGEGVASGG